MELGRKLEINIYMILMLCDNGVSNTLVAQREMSLEDGHEM
jgi:hypothetical protein